jgi:hypothetical protein
MVYKITPQTNTPVKKKNIKINSVIANPLVLHGCLFSIGHKNPPQFAGGVYQN